MTGMMYRWINVGEFREIDESVCAYFCVGISGSFIEGGGGVDGQTGKRWNAQAG